VLGSTQCSASGAFDVAVTLQFAISHTVTATVETITGQTGQTSQPFTITYVAAPTTPAPSTPSPTSKPPRGATTPPQTGLQILADKPFVVFGSQTDAVWTGSFAGGKRPYLVVVDWGDGETQRYSGLGTERQTFSHRYTMFKAYQVVITITDASGSTVSGSYAAATPLLFDTGPNAAGITQSLYGTHLSVPLLLYALYFSMLGLLAIMWRNHHKLASIPNKKNYRHTPRHA
jgi:hypothetical protein